jgi:cell division protease FtsH
MSGDDVVAVLEGTPGPLVDGRPYHSPEFIELVEEYHAQALEAHKAHSRPKAPLPVYAGALSAAYSAEPSGNGPMAEPETEVSES